MLACGFISPNTGSRWSFHETFKHQDGKFTHPKWLNVSVHYHSLLTTLSSDKPPFRSFDATFFSIWWSHLCWLSLRTLPSQLVFTVRPRTPFILPTSGYVLSIAAGEICTNTASDIGSTHYIRRARRWGCDRIHSAIPRGTETSSHFTQAISAQGDCAT